MENKYLEIAKNQFIELEAQLEKFKFPLGYGEAISSSTKLEGGK